MEGLHTQCCHLAHSVLSPGLSSAWPGGPVRSPRQVGKGLGCHVGHPEVLSPGSLYLSAEDGPGARVCPGDVVIGRMRQGWGAQHFPETPSIHPHG